MRLTITKQRGQYQFWHTDCPNNPFNSGILSDPENLENDVKQFTCYSCGKTGMVTMPRVIVGTGTLEEAGRIKEGDK